MPLAVPSLMGSRMSSTATKRSMTGPMVENATLSSASGLPVRKRQICVRGAFGAKYNREKGQTKNEEIGPKAKIKIKQK